MYDTGMNLNEFKDLLKKVLQHPESVDGVDELGGFVPTGGIILWSGSTVPTGWYLCDGTNDTPDLTSNFVLGGGLSDIGTTAAQVDVTVDNHVLGVPDNHTSAEIKNVLGKTTTTVTVAGATNVMTDLATNGNSVGHTGGSISAHNISQQPFPPYYTLAYLMKG